MLTCKALASTIMPISDEFFPLKKSRSKSSTATSFSRTYEDDFRDGLQVPLPPSSTSSQSGGALSVGGTRGDTEHAMEEGRTLRSTDQLAEEEHTHGSNIGPKAHDISVQVESEKKENRVPEERSGEAVTADEVAKETERIEVQKMERVEPENTRRIELKDTERVEPEETEGVENSTVKESTVMAMENNQSRVPNSSKSIQADTTDDSIMESRRSGEFTGESIGIGDAAIQDPSEKPLEEKVLRQQAQDTGLRSMEPPGSESPAMPLPTPFNQAQEDVHLPEAATKDVPTESSENQQVSPKGLSSVSLQELGLMVRRRDYEQRCLKVMENEVQDLTHRCAFLQRKTCLQSHLYRLMLTHFRAENLGDFGTSYQQSVQARDLSTNCLDTSTTPGLGQVNPTPVDSWVSKLSPSGSKTVVELLHQIRENPAFLPDCLMNLSTLQLGSVAQRTPDHSAAPSPQLGGSILSRSLDWSRQRTRHFADAKPKMEPASHNPLILIMYGVFDAPCSSDCREAHLRRERLIDSCVRLISSGKKGSNDFVLSILEVLVESSPWPSKLQLEQYITRLLQDGDFVLESLENQNVDFSEAATVSNARNAVATAEFYDRGLRTLLDLLTSESTCNIIPDGVLDFVRSVLSRIADPKQRSKARDFFVSRWYSTAFLSKALMYPEVSFLPQSVLHVTDLF